MPDTLTENIYYGINRRSGVYPAFFYGLFQFGRLFFKSRDPLPRDLHKYTTMENLTSIVKGTVARLVHVCNGKVIYQIQSGEHLYQLEINSNEKEWETTYLTPSFKSITLMRWIRKGMELNDGTFIKLN